MNRSTLSLLALTPLLSLSVTACSPRDGGSDASTDVAVAEGAVLDSSVMDSGTNEGADVVEEGVEDVPPAPRPEVRTAAGTVRGTNGRGFQAFLGIPYAEPPVGALRWRSPVPKMPWMNTREAQTPGSACAQNALGAGLGAEDCLFVNVHTPNPRPAMAPVLVWIHGGAFIFGEGLQADRGTAGDLIAARQGVVVVSMNYRLGNFGWFTHAGLGANGNQGFEDQQLALRWVHDNIAAFGGDPNNVTIVGESAGGLSVCLHLIAPASRGLFHRAISQSGLCDSPLPSRAEHVTGSNTIVTSLRCDIAPDPVACLRGKTMEEVRAVGGVTSDVLGSLASNARISWPSVDGTIIPGDFRRQVMSGMSADVPAIFGWNRDEGTLFVGLAELAGMQADAAAYHRTMASLAASNNLSVASIEAQYPLGSFPDPGAAIAAPIGHASLACPSRRAALLFARAGRPVRAYNFRYPDASFQLMLTRTLGAYHSAEIQFVFGHPARLGQPFFTGVQDTLWQAQSAYWGRFVKTGDPNGMGALPWPAFSPDTAQSLVLDRVISVDSNVDRDACAFWDAG